MSVISEWEPLSQTIDYSVAEEVREDLRHYFWRWYEKEKGRVLVKKRILFWSVEIKVGDLTFLFVQLFGANPYA